MVIFARDVTATSKGILGPAPFRSVNIFDESSCWGVWLPLPKHLGESDWKKRNAGHLVVAPIHPSAWPFLLRIQLFLEDRESALADAAEAIASLGVNIMISECAPAGYRHAVWSIIGYLATDGIDNLRKDKASLDRTKQTSDGRTSKDLAIRTTAMMQSEAERLRFEILRWNDRKRGGKFLRERILEGRSVLAFQVGKQDKKQIREIHEAIEAATMEEMQSWTSSIDKRLKQAKSDPIVRACLEGDKQSMSQLILGRQFPPAVSVRWMSRMAYYAFSGDAPHQPLEFQYDKRKKLAEYKGPEGAWLNRKSLKGKELPLPALACFHTRDKYVRIAPFARNAAAYVHVPYTIERKSAPTDAARGLLSVLARQIGCVIDKAPANFLHQTQRYMSFDGSEETGELTFLTETTTGRVDDAELITEVSKYQPLKDLAGIRGDTSDLSVSLGAARVSRFGMPKLFVSTRFADAYFLQLLEECARSAGFEPVLGGQNPFEGLTSSIIESIQNCDAAAFVAWATPEELAKNVARLGWLQSELGMATALKKPTARLVDKTLAENNQELFPIDQDKRTVQFDRFASPEDLKSVITQWLDTLRVGLNTLSR